MTEPIQAEISGRVAIFQGKGVPFEIRSFAVRALQPGEVLVKNTYTTICGSDVHTYCGRRQEPSKVVMGHEIVGEIIAIDPAHPGVDFTGAVIQPGDRITWAIFTAPAGAEAPRQDLPQKSKGLFKYGHVLAEGDHVFSGGLADYCILRPNAALIRLPETVPDQVAATISCAHATVAGALRMAGDIQGKKVLVFGAGLLGLSCLAMCSERGAAWSGIIDKQASRLRWGTAFSADAVYEMPYEQSPVVPWPEADIVFDFTGNPNVMTLGLNALLTGGVAVWIGAAYPADPVSVNAEQVVRKVLTIRGLHNYNYEDFIYAAGFIERNHDRFPFRDLVETEFSLGNVEEAFAFAADAQPVRVGIRI